MSSQRPSILLTGATGYVGGRLLPMLERLGFPVTCVSRQPAKLRRAIGPGSLAVRADVRNRHDMLRAFRDIDTAFYLVHSLSERNFEKVDRDAAINFARAARQSGARRIIYLGGLGDVREDLSSHLRSRHEVGRCLAEH